MLAGWWTCHRSMWGDLVTDVVAMCPMGAWYVLHSIINRSKYSHKWSSWKVLLVTGGIGNDSVPYPNIDWLDTTELLVPGSNSWRLATSLLPQPMGGVRVASVDNTLFLAGRNTMHIAGWPVILLFPYFLILLSFFGLILVLNILLWLQNYEIGSFFTILGP